MFNFSINTTDQVFNKWETPVPCLAESIKVLALAASRLTNPSLEGECGGSTGLLSTPAVTHYLAQPDVAAF